MTNRGSSETGGVLSRATAQRMSQYLRCIPTGPPGATISSSQLAHAMGVSDAQVRRDLATLGHLGQRGVGYDAIALAAAIRRLLGLDRSWRAVLVGVGNLARALLRYRGFQDRGFEIVGLFDSDPVKISSIVEGLPVRPTTTLIEAVPQLEAELGILTVPAESAQSVADLLTKAGVKGLLSFAPALLRVPSDVRVVTVDLTIQFEQLAFLVNLKNDSMNE